MKSKSKAKEFSPVQSRSVRLHGVCPGRGSSEGLGEQLKFQLQCAIYGLPAHWRKSPVHLCAFEKAWFKGMTICPHAIYT